jgi:hypothetical protein
MMFPRRTVRQTDGPTVIFVQCTACFTLRSVGELCYIEVEVRP